MILSLLMVPLGLCFIIGTIVSKLVRLRCATDPREKAYWKWSIAANLLFAYGLLVLGLLAADILRGEPWQLSERWPSLFADWYNARDHVLAVLLDVLMSLVAALASMGFALYFGYVDDNDVWHPSILPSLGRLVRRKPHSKGVTEREDS
ncbi:MAG TPA: hypothetical protein VEC01_14125 [Noviherbaspirillum sp.]|uniref:hypothetical protein n=1 Tax=Noviherbaspirillum sp. TaxID=1926288 RepID=UPI002D47F8CB|nr:hypothetical protein [Noviherbaspirillum sp.]HYD96463.1 hypothetical protein [Noviherbaspirillum sp.]